MELEPAQHLAKGTGTHFRPARGRGNPAQKIEESLLERNPFHDCSGLLLVELRAVSVRADNGQARSCVFQRHERVEAGCVGIRIDQAYTLPLLRGQRRKVERDGASAGCAVGAPNGQNLADAVPGLVTGRGFGGRGDVRMQGLAVAIFFLESAGVFATGCEPIDDGGSPGQHGFFVARDCRRLGVLRHGVE